MSSEQFARLEDPLAPLRADRMDDRVDLLRRVARRPLDAIEPHERRALKQLIGGVVIRHWGRDGKVIKHDADPGRRGGWSPFRSQVSEAAAAKREELIAELEAEGFDRARVVVF